MSGSDSPDNAGSQPKPHILLEGGPFDGCLLPIDPVEQSLDEVVLRATEYHPGGPREWVYRRDAGASLDPARIARNLEAGARVAVYRLVGQSELVRRVQEQDQVIARLDKNVNRLMAPLGTVARRKHGKSS